MKVKAVVAKFTVSLVAGKVDLAEEFGSFGGVTGCQHKLFVASIRSEASLEVFCARAPIGDGWSCSFAVPKQSLEDQLAQVNKTESEGGLTVFTPLLDTEKADLAKAEKSLAALVSSQASVKGFVTESMEVAGATH